MVTLAGVRDCSSGVRDAVMTVWLVASIGKAGIFILPVDEPVVTEGCAASSAAGPTPRGWTRPRKRTTDQGRFLTSPMLVGSQLRAQRRIFAGFPLNRPR